MSTTKTGEGKGRRDGDPRKSTQHLLKDRTESLEALPKE